jgi:hypothetical protein
MPFLNKLLSWYLTELREGIICLRSSVRILPNDKPPGYGDNRLTPVLEGERREGALILHA